MLHSKTWIMRLKRILGIAFIVHLAFCGICFAGFWRDTIDDFSRKAQKRLQKIDRKIAKEEVKKEVNKKLKIIAGLSRKARKRLQAIDKKITKEELREELKKELKAELKEILIELRSLFDKAESLFNKEKYEEAANLYYEIDRISSDREVKKLLEKGE